jgi:hypothetical protein
MNDRIRQLLADIATLEDELSTLLQEQQARLRYRIEGTKIRFDANLRKIHDEFRTGLIPWLRASELRNIVSAPFVYLMIVPFVLLDLLLALYQAVCFRLYRIPRVKRSSYVVIDRHQLHYLNAIEKLNCAYCGYASGLLAYARQIVLRTEMYWCPIKHARKILDPDRRYATFSDFGDAENYRPKVAAMRSALETYDESDDHADRNATLGTSDSARTADDRTKE